MATDRLTSEHLHALFAALAALPESDTKHRVRELAGFVYAALRLVDEQSFVVAMAQTFPDDILAGSAPTTPDPFLAALERPTEVVQDDAPVDLRVLPPVDAVDALVNLGISVLSQRGDTAGLEDVLVWYEQAMLNAMEREDVLIKDSEAAVERSNIITPLTSEQQDILIYAMDHYRRVLIQDGGTASEIEAVIQTEDAILDQLGG